MWYRFIIHVWVKDGTGEAYFMLLDWIAIGVVPDSAAALLNVEEEHKKEDTYFARPFSNT